MGFVCIKCGSEGFQVNTSVEYDGRVNSDDSVTLSPPKADLKAIFNLKSLITVTCVKCDTPQTLYFDLKKHEYQPFRPLTKSRFQMALGCPTKIFYEGNSNYLNNDSGNEFLRALAEGGYQVGELAKLYFPGGLEVSNRGYEDSLNETNEYLSQQKVIIYEGAFQYSNLFIRTDIILKNGMTVDLIEVKSKSISNKDISTFIKKNREPKKEWEPYLYDVAFQKHVLKNALPDYTINCYLMLADKEVEASVNALNQQFSIEKDSGGRIQVKYTGDRNNPKIGRPILAKIDVDDIVNDILIKPETGKPSELYFENLITLFSDSYRKGTKIDPILGTKCIKCEFKSDGHKSGFKECWKQAAYFSEEDFLRPLTLDLWGAYMQDRKDVLIKSGKYFLSDLRREDIAPNEKPSLKPGLSHVDRKMVQIEKMTKGETDSYWDVQGLEAAFSKFKYPLHFIDFETSSVAIPFSIGRRPYEGIAFQFSHHIVTEDGTIRHQGQYLNSERGVFPNFEFIRALKSELETDHGTIFRWAPHENTYLNIIYNQLMEYSKSEIPDKDELAGFIKSVSHSTEKSEEKWMGDRDMVDMWDLEKKHYYNPSTKGSNSIKDVLPAVLSESALLQNKYSQPIYGKDKGIISLNFEEINWIQYDGNQNIINPYKLLPPLFEGVDEDQLDSFITDNMLADGGAAMTAYAKMQFTEMSHDEKLMLEHGLLRYCELDTLAMVMIYEHWKSILAIEI